MRIVALDIGEKRIGVATGDDESGLARPYRVLTRRSNAAAWTALARVVVEQQAELVVVGLPISFDGQLHGQARAVRSFAEHLRQQLSVPLVYQDETLSTARAEDALRAAGVRPDRIRERIDAAAAAIILQEYLDARDRLKALPAMGGQTADAGLERSQRVQSEPGDPADVETEEARHL